LDSGTLATTRISDDVVDLVASRPGTFRPSQYPGAGLGFGSCNLRTQ
jgi:hypothetical protein